jgi:formate C-acetyltransferase
VAALRRRSVDAKATVSMERARLMTEFYRSAKGLSAPMLRARAFAHLMERKAVVILEGELIVGERGPAPKASPTYPELCCHTVEDLEVLGSREKIPYAVDSATTQFYEREAIPFWRDRSLRDQIFANMTPEWLAAYDAGIFTEFMEQRAPGHTAGGGQIFRKGFLDYRREIEEELCRLDFLGDPRAYDKQEELRAMSVTCDAIIRFAERHAELARELAAREADEARRLELLKIAEVCGRVPAHAPRTFWEGLQAYWFVHLGVITELNTWDAFNPGRLDQHLYPLYRQDLDSGRLTEEQAKELLECFWVKFNNQPAPPKVGVTNAESGTYTDFANINSGGLGPDGSDGVNELSYLVLDVIDEMRLLQPSSNVQISKKTPDRFLRQALRIVRKGWGQPSIFNADAVVQELLRQGKTPEDAREGGTSGCVEAGAFGKEAYILTGYFNLVKILELTLHDGVDPRTGRQLGPRTGDPRQFADFDALIAAYDRQMRYFLDVKIQGNNVIERLYARQMPAPFLSVITDDCIRNGRDYNDGGPRYNTSYIQGVGIGTLTDSLSAIKRHVYDERAISVTELLGALARDFDGDEDLRSRLMDETPRYGNDDDAADDIMRRLFDLFQTAVDGRPNTKGGTYRIDMLPTTCHIYFGSVTGATPEGRHAWQPVSEGISPVQGADRNGPTAVVKSMAKMDHIRTGGTLLNMKFIPQVLEGDENLEKLLHLVRAYFRMDGHHIQFNVVSAETLRDAQLHPEEYRDLIVRVAGYSDYFCDLSRALQDEIIARTEQVAF